MGQPEEWLSGRRYHEMTDQPAGAGEEKRRVGGTGERRPPGA